MLQESTAAHSARLRWATDDNADGSAVFATFPIANENGFRSTCLAMFSMADNTTQTAKEHIEISSYVHNVFDMFFHNVIPSIVYSCINSQSIGIKLKKPLISCLSHRFQLTVRETIWDVIDAVERVH